MKIKDFRELVESKGFDLVLKKKSPRKYRYNVYYKQLLFLQADTLNESKNIFDKIIPLFENGTIKSDGVQWVHGETDKESYNFEWMASKLLKIVDIEKV